MRRWIMGMGWTLGLGLSTVVLAQDPPKTCEEQLQIVQIELEITRRDASRSTQAASADLARWMQRAQAAEKRVAQKPPDAPQAPSPAPESK
jgi:hypothetical protein